MREQQWTEYGMLLACMQTQNYTQIEKDQIYAYIRNIPSDERWTVMNLLKGQSYILLSQENSHRLNTQIKTNIDPFVEQVEQVTEDTKPTIIPTRTTIDDPPNPDSLVQVGPRDALFKSFVDKKRPEVIIIDTNEVTKPSAPSLSLVDQTVVYDQESRDERTINDIRRNTDAILEGIRSKEDRSITSGIQQLLHSIRVKEEEMQTRKFEDTTPEEEAIRLFNAKHLALINRPRAYIDSQISMRGQRVERDIVLGDKSETELALLDKPYKDIRLR
jgi:hypothetical protein